MLVRIDGVSAALNVCRELLWRLGIFLFFVLRVLGQASSSEVSSATANVAAKVAAPSASAAMQESVLRQSMAVQAAQQKAQKGSLSQQRASLRLQHQDAIAGVPQTPLAAPANNPSLFSDDFFSTRWEPAPPAAMPNVRIPTTACPALAGEEVDKLINLAAGKNAVSAGLIRAVMKQESAFHPCAVSTAGAMGLMQIMPGTAETLGLEDAFSPGENVDAGARYLKQLLDRYHGDRRLALGAYNAGPARVDNAGGIPDIPETIDYVSRILGDVPDEEPSVGVDSSKSGSENVAAPAQAPQMPVTPAVAPPIESPVPPDASSSPRTAPAPPPAP